MSTSANAGLSPPTEWLSIREASALVGVSVATLRRWCDAGLVGVFTTPGGHRRFERAAVLSLIPSGGPPPTIADNGETAIRMVRACRRANRRSPALAPTLAAMPGRDLDDFRRLGRQVVAALVEALDDGPTDNTPAHARARDAAGACGRLAKGAGMSLQEALALFVHFRAPFLHELGSVCRRRGLGATATAAILERASEAVDGLMPAVISGFEGAA